MINLDDYEKRKDFEMVVFVEFQQYVSLGMKKEKLKHFLAKSQVKFACGATAWLGV